MFRTPSTSRHDGAALTSGQLDDGFVSMVQRSLELHSRTAAGAAIDEMVLAAMIAALVDGGYVLIDLSTAGASTGSSVNSSGAHHARFEDPETRSRVSIALGTVGDPMTESGQRPPARLVVGYSEQVPNFNQVGQALRQEVASAFVGSSAPGAVTFEAEISSGYVTAQIDLLVELESYVNSNLDIDRELLERQVLSVIHTLQSFTRARFGN